MARRTFHTTVGLSTFRDVPFNALFYSRRGFVIHPLDDVPAGIADQVRREVPPGAQISDRVLMLRKL
ncbi:hypothetical protein [Oricola cellulosilytica]|uniref:Uncharacterized protein n=1 Tax=Oricola cellulosilytica TaxID=1429082 RepID=A0A4R0PEZ7_9HYPH|nr:hypothetical protein [Oricola cellulosilytica]TCD16396.1 hypothetical protein E0D97_02925 [Oricola cellulosilytica]